jgi:hypothetical protein
MAGKRNTIAKRQKQVHHVNNAYGGKATVSA